MVLKAEKPPEPSRTDEGENLNQRDRDKGCEIKTGGIEVQKGKKCMGKGRSVKRKKCLEWMIVEKFCW